MRCLLSLLSIKYNLFTVPYTIKRYVALFTITLLLLSNCTHKAKNNTLAKNNVGTLRNGDIIFQTSASTQSKAITLATHSPYSHVGIVFFNAGSAMVIEAVQPVKITPLNQWIARGQNAAFVVKRLKNDTLNKAQLFKMKKNGESYLGKNYDYAFAWSDQKMYCSELVWKLYKNGADIQLCTPAKLSDFDLTHPAVKQILKKRYGNKIPLNETVVSPAQLFNSPLLVVVNIEL